MPFLSSETLQKVLKIVIKPFNKVHVKYCAYELTLGNEILITGTEEIKKVKCVKGEQILIPPGQFAYLITEETIKVPNNLIAFISIKASIKFQGLINVSGFHVDPGFEGKIKFAVYNAGVKHLPLTIGDPTFLIWFSRLDRMTKDTYNGIHYNQNEISDKDVYNYQGHIVSPAALKNDFDNLKTTINTINMNIAIFWVLFSGLILLVIALLVTQFPNLYLKEYEYQKNDLCNIKKSIDSLNTKYDKLLERNTFK